MHGTMEKKPSHSKTMERLMDFIMSDNIAEDLDEDRLGAIGLEAKEQFDLDEMSRDEWKTSADKAMDAALQVREPKNYPYEGASNVKYPLVLVAALQFNARSYPALVDGNQVVKGRVIGSDKGIPVIDQETGQQAVQVMQDPNTGEPVQIPQWKLEPGAKRARAERISKHMSYQLLEEMEEWEEDTDALLFNLPIIGCAFRKTYYDEIRKRNVSEMVSAFDLVVNQKAKSLDTAPRISHRFELYPYEIEERKRSGLYLEDVDCGIPSDADGDPDAAHMFIEQHRYLDLDEDGLNEPYIVTFHEETHAVVRIVANYTAGDIEEDAERKRVVRIKKNDYFTKYTFIPDPKGGFYGIGFGHLLESLGAAIDTSINQMLDAGHLQNAGGGFIGSGLRLKKGLIRLEPGVYRPVSVPGGKIRDSIYNMEHPGPSPVLFQMLDLLLMAAKDITATKDVMTGEMPREQPATTTLAMIEQGMKVFTAIYKRVYKAFKREFKLLFRINADHLPDETYFMVLDDMQSIARDDYDESNYDVCPQADPRMVTDMQRLARAQLLMELREDPFVNQMEAHRRFFDAAGYDDVDSLIQEPQPDPMQMAQVETVQADTMVKGATAQKMEADRLETLAGIEQEDDKMAIDVAKEEARHEMEAKKLEQQARSEAAKSAA